MLKFSIIIPVYNAEKTIERCLESIRIQQYENYEVIIMDDGSTDASLSICQKYQSLDNRFKVFHQKNSGPSVARNRCLAIATGQWICFVDSDDTISKQYLERINRAIIEENPEVVFMGYRQFNAAGEELEIKLPGKVSTSYYKTLTMLSNNDMFGYTWIKCIKRECISDICFDEKLNLFEDEVFACEVLKNCSNVSLINEALYDYYIGTEGALTQRTYLDYCQKCDSVFTAWVKLLEKSDVAKQVLQEKANMYVERCKYYGIERPVNIEEFFGDLADMQYFALCTNKGQFEKYVADRSHRMIKFNKFLYHLKNKIVKLIKH